MLSLLLITAGAIADTPAPAVPSQAAVEQRQPPWWQGNDFQWVRGANYIPGYAYNSYAQWDKYDPLAFTQQTVYSTVNSWLVLGQIADVEYGTSSKVGPSRFEGGEITPTFRVLEEETEVLGRDTRSQHPGLCRPRMDGGTSVYSAAPCVITAVLRFLATSAGVHVYVDEDAVVYANASLVTAFFGVR